MTTFLHQRERPLQNDVSVSDPPHPLSPPPPPPPPPPSSTTTNSQQKPSAIFCGTGFLVPLSLLLLALLGLFSPWVGNGIPQGLFVNITTGSDIIDHEVPLSRWRDYTLAEGAAHVAKDGATVIVCAVSLPYLPFLNNWLISVTRQKHHGKVLVIAEDYATLYKVNEKWPGHAVLVPPAPDIHTEHKFGSQGFFNFTSRRPRYLLEILELGYSVMYNDVDMVWVADPFPYLQGKHDVYFTDDMVWEADPLVKPLNHSHDFPPAGTKGETNICTCMIYLRPTSGAKLVIKKWIEECQAQTWSEGKGADQPAFNWALKKTTAGEADLYLLQQAAFPNGWLYFNNQTWVQETKGMHVIIHNNYIRGFDNKLKRFNDFGLWLVDDHAQESPLGRL